MQFEVSSTINVSVFFKLFNFFCIYSFYFDQSGVLLPRSIYLDCWYCMWATKSNSCVSVLSFSDSVLPCSFSGIWISRSCNSSVEEFEESILLLSFTVLNVAFAPLFLHELLHLMYHFQSSLGLGHFLWKFHPIRKLLWLFLVFLVRRVLLTFYEWSTLWRDKRFH